MVAFLAPIGFALGGGALFGNIGMAVGWMVGSWLFGPKQKKNEIFDPGAEEMPRPTQALRGITMPIFFGTNRVPAQMVWQHDYTVNRVEGETDGGGGGKFGGSGGKFGGQSQEGPISYEYKWDLIYHLGMVNTEMTLIRAWLGSTAVNPEAVAAINDNMQGTISIITESDEDEVNLTFEDSFFYSGFGPALGVSDSAAAYDGWDEVLTDEGIPARWPHTCYVGFKQLFLGNYPGTPALTFEVGPAETSLLETGNLLLNEPGDNGLSAQQRWMGNNAIVQGDDGEYYSILTEWSSSGFDNIKIHRLNLDAETSVQTETLTSTSIRTKAATFGMDLSNRSSEFYGMAAGGIGYSNYIAITGAYYQTTGYPNDQTYFCLLGKINSSGAFEIIGTNQLPGGFWQFQFQSNIFLGSSNNYGDEDPIVAIVTTNVFGNTAPSLIVYDTPNNMIGNNTTGTANWTELDDPFDNSWHGLRTTSSERKSFTDWFIIPYVVSVVPSIVIGTRLCTYVGPSDIGSTAIAEVVADGATYPDGYIAYLDLGQLTAETAPTIPATYSIGNGWFGAADFPFDDTNLHADGSTTFANDKADYYPSASVIRLTQGSRAGAFLLTFVSLLPDDGTHDYVNGTAYSSLSRVKVFLWDYATDEMTLLTSGQSEAFDRAGDFGLDDTATYSPRDQKFIYLENEGRYYLAGSMIGSGLGINGRAYITEGGNFNLGSASDVTPPYIIKQILTSPIFGIGLSESQIDNTSYQAAVDYCEAQNFKISVQYRREQSALGAIDDLLSTYGGFLVISNGVVKFKQLEWLNGSANPVRTIDNKRLVSDGNSPPVNVTKGARQDTFNKIRVNYIDRNLDYVQNQVEDQDELDQELNGVRMREFPAIYVMGEGMARTMCERALWSNLYARDTYEFSLGWKDQDLEPGDVITLVDSHHPQLSYGAVCRIVSWKESQRGKFDVVAKQEFEYISTSSAAPLNVTSASQPVRGGITPQPIYQVAYELPANYAAGRTVYFGYWATGKSAGANVFVSVDGESYAKVLNIEPYPIAGRLLDGLPDRPWHQGYVEENIRVALFPANPTSFYLNGTLPDVTQSMRRSDQGMLLIGSEMITYEGVTLVSQNVYRLSKVFRGQFDTHIHGHSSGDIFIKHSPANAWRPASFGGTGDIGKTINYKIVPYGFGGKSMNISSITASQYTYEYMQGKSYAPANLQFLVNSEGQRGTVTHQVASGSDIPVRFYDRTVAGRSYGQGITTMVDFGQHIKSFDYTTEDFIVTVVKSGGTSVSTWNLSESLEQGITDSVPYVDFIYTFSANVADNGVWHSKPAFYSHIKGQYNVSRFSETLSLNLWT